MNYTSSYYMQKRQPYKYQHIVCQSTTRITSLSFEGIANNVRRLKVLKDEQNFILSIRKPNIQNSWVVNNLVNAYHHFHPVLGLW